MKTFLENARKILTILFAPGIDKHLDNDQEETGLQEHQSEKKRVEKKEKLAVLGK